MSVIFHGSLFLSIGSLSSTVRISQLLLQIKLPPRIAYFSQWGCAFGTPKPFLSRHLGHPPCLIRLKQRIWQPPKHVSPVIKRHHNVIRWAVKTKTITIRVNESLYQDFADMAESEGTNLSGLARQAIENICHQTSSERHQNVIRTTLNGTKAKWRLETNKSNACSQHSTSRNNSRL